MNKAQAEWIAGQIVELQEDIALLRLTSGIQEKESQVKALRDGLRDYMIESSTSRVKAGDNKYARLVESAKERIWIGTDKDVPAGMAGKKSLKSLLPRRLWMAVSKRVPDPQLILEAVERGDITLERIAPAYYERMKAPYVRVFNNNDQG